jgi:hypothetical protein
MLLLLFMVCLLLLLRLLLSLCLLQRLCNALCRGKLFSCLLFLQLSVYFSGSRCCQLLTLHHQQPRLQLLDHPRQQPEQRLQLPVSTNITEHYRELTAAAAVFGQLQECCRVLQHISNLKLQQREPPAGLQQEKQQQQQHHHHHCHRHRFN